jgi:hypothetical protein
MKVIHSVVKVIHQDRRLVSSSDHPIGAARPKPATVPRRSNAENAKAFIPVEYEARQIAP